MIAAGEKYRELIVDEIGALFSRRIERAARTDRALGLAWEHAAEAVGGGKLLRPLLLMGAFDALRSNATPVGNDAAAIRVAAAVEVLHYAFLLHDDVIDGDLHRRGRPNLIGTLVAAHPDAPERALHWGRSTGILVGDVLLADVHRVVATAPASGAERDRLLQLLEETITDAVLGEHLDVALADRVLSPDPTTVREMTRLKTAGYTFELPLRAAAILAGAGEPADAEIGAVGRHLGVLFQLQDDRFSTFGDSATHGKDELSDLREGKQTAIIAFARTQEHWPRIAAVLEDAPLSTQDAVTVRDLLLLSGADGHLDALIEAESRDLRTVLAGSTALPDRALAFIGSVLTAVQERRW